MPWKKIKNLDCKNLKKNIEMKKNKNKNKTKKLENTKKSINGKIWFWETYCSKLSGDKGSTE